ncbi:hypothetical protein BDV11DRAFT_192519 [Aspergillus similis]
MPGCCSLAGGAGSTRALVPNIERPWALAEIQRISAEFQPTWTKDYVNYLPIFSEQGRVRHSFRKKKGRGRVEYC